MFTFLIQLLTATALSKMADLYVQIYLERVEDKKCSKNDPGIVITLYRKTKNLTKLIHIVSISHKPIQTRIPSRYNPMD